MNRFRLVPLTALLAATGLAHADIPVEERPLSAAAPAQVRIAASSAATPSASPAPAATAAQGPAATAPGSGNGMWQQYTQVEQLQQQIQQLQGLVEQQGFLIERLQNDLRVRYTDIDQRLTAQQEQLQQAAAAAAAASAPAAGATSAATTPVTPPSATIEEEKRAYLAAYDTFRVGGPDKAIPPMLAFVKRYPNSSFVPSAYYWLGEFYLNASTPDQAAAQKQFDIVLSNYPNSPKAAAALYKTGAILDLRGKPMEARKRMQELLEKYPKSPESALAQSYLDALESASKPAAEPPAAAKPSPQSATRAPAAKTAKAAKTSHSGKTGKSVPQTSSRKKN